MESINPGPDGNGINKEPRVTKEVLVERTSDAIILFFDKTGSSRERIRNNRDGMRDSMIKIKGIGEGIHDAKRVVRGLEEINNDVVDLEGMLGVTEQRVSELDGITSNYLSENNSEETFLNSLQDIETTTLNSGGLDKYKKDLHAALDEKDPEKRKEQLLKLEKEIADLAEDTEKNAEDHRSNTLHVGDDLNVYPALSAISNVYDLASMLREQFSSSFYRFQDLIDASEGDLRSFNFVMQDALEDSSSEYRQIGDVAHQLGLSISELFALMYSFEPEASRNA